MYRSSRQKINKATDILNHTIEQLRVNWYLSRSVQSLSHVWLFATPWIAARQASLSSPTPGACSNSCPVRHWCHSTISSSAVPFSSRLQPFPASVSFPMKSILLIRWPKYWSFSFSISPSNLYSGLISFKMDWLDLLAVQGTLKISNTTVQKHQFFSAQFSL